ncbi:MAG: class II glutamine amidotransferase [Planctomycetes bacterium]|nr:class II glutamine amidotransferase [Planctomycetota bacterium]MCB9904270.1 class II glutamine amidotransferase [Planctomycetota bacterium]
MCRFTLYSGPSLPLSALLFEPDHSLIRQSVHSDERSEPLNGDGFGVGWYAPEIGAEPGVFRSITPAWNNRNLASLSKVVTSPLVLAHVRAASVLSGVNEANCHPFRFENYLFMHNGDVGNFRAVRRAMIESVSNAAFDNIYGSTDSEHVFGIVIDELLRLSAAEPAQRLADAVEYAIRRTVELVRRHGDGAPCYLNFALSDGEHAVVSRFTSAADEEPESLYLYHGAYPLQAEPGDEARGTARLVSSERLSDDDGWTAIPANHLVVLPKDEEPRFVALDGANSATRAA